MGHRRAFERGRHVTMVYVFTVLQILVVIKDLTTTFIYLSNLLGYKGGSHRSRGDELSRYEVLALFGDPWSIGLKNEVEY